MLKYVNETFKWAKTLATRCMYFMNHGPFHKCTKYRYIILPGRIQGLSFIVILYFHREGRCKEFIKLERIATN